MLTRPAITGLLTASCEAVVVAVGRSGAQIWGASSIQVCLIPTAAWSSLIPSCSWIPAARAFFHVGASASTNVRTALLMIEAPIGPRRHDTGQASTRTRTPARRTLCSEVTDDGGRRCGNEYHFNCSCVDSASFFVATLGAELVTRTSTPFGKRKFSALLTLVDKCSSRCIAGESSECSQCLLWIFSFNDGRDQARATTLNGLPAHILLRRIALKLEQCQRWPALVVGGEARQYLRWDRWTAAAESTLSAAADFCKDTHVRQSRPVMPIALPTRESRVLGRYCALLASLTHCVGVTLYCNDVEHEYDIRNDSYLFRILLLYILTVIYWNIAFRA